MAAGPDQGFAWVIALACFLINFIMAGVARTAGVLYVAIINLYGVSRESATTPFSIRVCVRNITGPLVGLLGQKYGIRVISTIGGLVAALGSIFCYFAPNIFWITMFWGVIHGLGFGLSTVLHMITINQYFDKYKASALGLGYSGDCFGTFVFPVIMEHLIATYGLRGTFLVLGGIVLNVIPMALLLRRPPWIKDVHKPKKSKRNSKKKHETSTIKKHTNSLLLERNKILKSHSHLGFLTTVDENDSLERGQMNESRMNDHIANPKNCVTFGCDARGHCNKAFESSETNLSSLSIGELQNIKRTNASKSLENLEKIKPISAPSPSHFLMPGTSKTFQCFDTRSSNSSINDSRHYLKTEDLRACSEMRGSKSVGDFNRKNESHCNINRSPLLSKLHNLQSQQRRESLPPVFERDTCLTDRNEKSESHEDVEREVTNNDEIPRIEITGIPRRLSTATRTSSFVGQVAHEIVNRMRTASFASQAAQDGFVATIGQESESDSEPELECELKSIVKHRDHDIGNCTQQDLVLSVDRNMMDDYFKDFPQETDSVAEEKPQAPSVIKVLLRTNTKPMFILISISMAVYAFLFVSVLTIIIDYASDLGISEDQGKYLIIGFSVADLVGRLSFGQVIDRNLMKMKNYSGTSMVLMGALVAVIPLNTSFNYIMVCMCMYGVVQGGTAIMFPILINLYMEKNTESVAMGCLNFYGGVLMLLMAPMIGFFRDKTGSYNCVFYIIGGVVAVVGIIWQFEPMIIKFQNKKLREKYIMKEISMMNNQQ